MTYCFTLSFTEFSSFLKFTYKKVKLVDLRFWQKRLNSVFSPGTFPGPCLPSGPTGWWRSPPSTGSTAPQLPTPLRKSMWKQKKNYLEGIKGINQKPTMSSWFKMFEYLGRVCAKANTPGWDHCKEEYYQTTKLFTTNFQQGRYKSHFQKETQIQIFCTNTGKSWQKSLFFPTWAGTRCMWRALCCVGQPVGRHCWTERLGWL